MIFTKDYWKAALERAITAAAAAVAGLGLGSVTGALNDINKAKAFLLTAVGAFIFSIVKGLAANATNNGTGPGFGKAEVTKEAAEVSGADAPPVVDEGETKAMDGTAVAEDSAVADPAPVNSDSVLMTNDEESAVDPATVVVSDGALNAYSPEFDPAQADVDHADDVLASETQAAGSTVVTP